MSSYELVFLRNIPFLSKSDGGLYYYDGNSVAHSEEPVRIGTYNKEHDTFALVSDWKDRVKGLRERWLDGLIPGERGQGTPRAAKPKRTVAKTTPDKAKSVRGAKRGRNVVCPGPAGV